MANPQAKRASAASVVASCSATDCTHNQHQECHAGEIRVEIGARGAVCATYTSERTKARP